MGQLFHRLSLSPSDVFYTGDYREVTRRCISFPLLQYWKQRVTRVGGRKLRRECKGPGQDGINPLGAQEAWFSRRGALQLGRLRVHTGSKQESIVRQETDTQSFLNIRCPPIFHSATDGSGTHFRLRKRHKMLSKGPHPCRSLFKGVRHV